MFAHYREWRDDGNRPGQFLPHLLQAWEIGDYDWDDRDMNVILEEMQRSEQAVFERLTRDGAIIALAFAQIIVDGVAQPKTLDRALKAVDRLSIEIVWYRIEVADRARASGRRGIGRLVFDQMTIGGTGADDGRLRGRLALFG